MEKIVRILKDDGQVIIDDDRKKTSDRVIITSDDNSFGSILDVKKLDKMFDIFENNYVFFINRIVSIIAKDDFILEDIIQMIGTLNGNFDASELFKLIDNVLSKYEKLEKKPTLDSSYLSLKKLKEIMEGNNSYINTGLITLNKFYVNKNASSIHGMIYNIFKMTSDDYIIMLMNKINNVKNKKDLNDIYDYLLKFSFSKKSLLENFRLYNEDLALSIMSKEIVKYYVKKLVLDDKIENIQFSEVNDIKNLLLKVLYDETLEKMLDSRRMLCWDCRNGYTSKCEKIRDLSKKKIEDYPFIVEGYQMYNNSDLDRFIVSKCKNFQSTKVKKLKK